MINWSLMGDPNASLPTPQPVFYRPMFGAMGKTLQDTCITFVSQAALEDGVKEKPGLRDRWLQLITVVALANMTLSETMQPHTLM